VAALDAMSTYPPSTSEQGEESGESGDSLMSWYGDSGVFPGSGIRTSLTTSILGLSPISKGSSGGDQMLE